jgi:hypothetical protein
MCDFWKLEYQDDIKLESNKAIVKKVKIFGKVTPNLIVYKKQLSLVEMVIW